jgi:hypothetical protein
MIVTLSLQLCARNGRKLVYRLMRSVASMIAWMVKTILTLVFGRIISKLIK